MFKEQTPDEARKYFENYIEASFPKQINLDREETAQLICVSPGHLRNLDAENKSLFPHRSVGGKVVYQRNDIVEYLVSTRVRPGRKTKASKIEAAAAAVAAGGEQ